MLKEVQLRGGGCPPSRWAFFGLLGARGGRAVADLLNLTIAEAAPRIERGALSPVDLTDAMLARAKAVNPTLNAYITISEEQARAVAAASAAMIRAGYYLGPLHGIPIAIKDNIYTRG